MTYLLPYPLPLLLSGVFHWHLGIDGESTAIPTPESRPLPINQLIVNVEAIAGGAEKSTDATAYTLGGYSLPVVFILETG